MISHEDLAVGNYRLAFDVAAYFEAKGVALPQPNFLNTVLLDFGVAELLKLPAWLRFLVNY